MEPQQHLQQQPHQQQQNEDGNIGGGSSNKISSYNNNQQLCRQSTTRWTPTTEQIRILKDLYYNNGVRSPSAEQIQKISAKLRQYGKIEGKNVFYWFQNHKARERQKKRLNTEIPMQRSSPTTHVWRSSDHQDINPIYTKCTSFNSSGSSHGFNQLGNYNNGSLAMEKSFRDCSISPGGNGGGSMVHNFMWASGVHDHHPYPPSSYPNFMDKKKGYDTETLDDDEQEEHDDDHVAELETLPLFPMHEENISGGFCNMKQGTESYSYMNWYQTSDNNMGCSRASLELTLNSYGGCRSPNAP